MLEIALNHFTVKQLCDANVRKLMDIGVVNEFEIPAAAI